MSKKSIACICRRNKLGSLDIIGALYPDSITLDVDINSPVRFFGVAYTHTTGYIDAQMNNGYIKTDQSPDGAKTYYWGEIFGKSGEYKFESL